MPVETPVVESRVFAGVRGFRAGDVSCSDTRRAWFDSNTRFRCEDIPTNVHTPTGSSCCNLHRLYITLKNPSSHRPIVDQGEMCGQHLEGIPANQRTARSHPTLVSRSLGMASANGVTPPPGATPAVNGGGTPGTTKEEASAPTTNKDEQGAVLQSQAPTTKEGTPKGTPDRPTNVDNVGGGKVEAEKPTPTTSTPPPLDDCHKDFQFSEGNKFQIPDGAIRETVHGGCFTVDKINVLGDPWSVGDLVDHHGCGEAVLLLICVYPERENDQGPEFTAASTDDHHKLTRSLRASAFTKKPPAARDSDEEQSRLARSSETIQATMAKVLQKLSTMQSRAQARAKRPQRSHHPPADVYTPEGTHGKKHNKKGHKKKTAHEKELEKQLHTMKKQSKVLEERFAMVLEEKEQKDSGSSSEETESTESGSSSSSSPSSSSSDEKNRHAPARRKSKREHQREKGDKKKHHNKSKSSKKKHSKKKHTKHREHKKHHRVSRSPSSSLSRSRSPVIIKLEQSHRDNRSRSTSRHRARSPSPRVIVVHSGHHHHSSSSGHGHHRRH